MAGRRVGQDVRVRWRVRGARPGRAPAGHRGRRRRGRRRRGRPGTRLAGAADWQERARVGAGMGLDRTATRGTVLRRGQILDGRCGREAGQDRRARRGRRGGIPEGPAIGLRVRRQPGPTGLRLSDHGLSRLGLSRLGLPRLRWPSLGRPRPGLSG